MIGYVIIICVVTIGMLFMGVVALISLLMLYFALFGDLILRNQEKWKQKE